MRSAELKPEITNLAKADLSSHSSIRPPHSALLVFEQVSKWYGQVLGLNQVTLELRGGITGLVGSNGAGKSTLMKLATGQIRPTLGRVTVAGVDAWHWEARRLVGYCPDVDAFYEDMTGREFVRTMADLCGYPSAESKRRTEATLDRVGMSDRADRKLRGYSKGMRQRIKLAQALLTDPSLLVLDEPLSGIDPVGRQELLDLFRSLAAQGMGLLVSSHELEELEKLTNHVAIMARGRVAAVGTLQKIREMLEDFPLSVRIDVERPKDVAKLLLSLDEVTGVDVAGDTVTVRAHSPKTFFRDFGRLVVRERLDVRRLEPLDDSAHAILGYLLGGSGKT
ncbi:ABC transporter ATP-binding protein [Limnoglobus roseus]|uniref:ABC transporter ATP-binding protein n=1 Tax=Limnoglobus roseus TaxID=2598579 RepID=A0A5C1A429_9BACT|nr:ABC transporter ATP-binding protein [Limnoglobus roseus]QEL13370.1 ABC transporter ATP-binding protein [Limnoglobus roseus]